MKTNEKSFQMGIKNRRDFECLASGTSPKNNTPNDENARFLISNPVLCGLELCYYYYHDSNNDDRIIEKCTGQ